MTDDCPTCMGTGIGTWGPPDVAKCHSCGGSGVHRPSRDEGPPFDEDAYYVWKDQWEEERRERGRD